MTFTEHKSAEIEKVSCLPTLRFRSAKEFDRKSDASVIYAHYSF